MDPFNKFSPALRLHLLSVSDSRDAIRLSHASPALFELRYRFQSSFHRHFIVHTLDEDLIQDALAIIHFPRLGQGAFDSEAQRKSAVKAHLQVWGDKAFANPLKGAGRNTVQARQLKALLGKLWLYIKDYLSKATSQCLPHAYLELPSFSHDDFTESERQFTLSMSAGAASPFDLHLLTPDEQRRILHAFLRYEILCKIYSPLGHGKESRFTSTAKRIIVDDAEEGYEHNTFNPFRYWDWRLLEEYEKRKQGDSDRRLLSCVREYVVTVYGALIAEQGNVPIPDAQELGEFENAPRHGMRRVSDYDSLWGDENRKRAGEIDWSDGVVSLMATAGFDLLTSTLNSSGDDFRQFTFALSNETQRRPPHVNVTNVDIQIGAPSRKDQASWYANDFVRLHRQRAWALLEGPRQALVRLPTEEEYCDIYGVEPGGEKKDGWVLNEPRARNEFICHGRGFGTYPSLLLKLTPFWKG